MQNEKLGLFERSRLAKPLIQEQFAKALKALGIEGKAIPAAKLRARILAEGKIRPEDNEFSRGLIEMREE